MAVTHDRYFLDNVAGWILELDRGRGIPYEGNYSSLARAEAEAPGAGGEAPRSARQRTIAAELEWVRQNPKGRQTKQKARLQNFEALVAQERNVKLDEVQIHIPTATHLGDVVVEAEGLRKGFGDNLLIEDLSFSLPRGGIVGVIGANGAGKTTLFRMITGQEQPDAGTLRIGETVQMAYVDQSRDALDPDKTVWEEISGGMDQIKVGDREMNSRAYTSGFNFKGSDQQKKVGKLSGGERNRLHLAKLLRTGGNLLLLDEPTNDLDVDTLRALEEALLDFAGCAVVISHDRWFLDRIATHVLAFEGDSQVDVVRGQLRGLRGAPPRAARRRGRPPAPHHLQEAHAGVEPGGPLALRSHQPVLRSSRRTDDSEPVHAEVPASRPRRARPTVRASRRSASIVEPAEGQPGHRGVGTPRPRARLERRLRTIALAAARPVAR